MAPSPGRLDGRRFVITGCGSGIGRATAARVREEGGTVFGVDRAGAADLTIDVAQPGAAEAIVAAAIGALGGIDGIVPCAGICHHQPLEGHADDIWDSTLAVNVTAVFRLARAALPALRASGHGRIVLIGSVMSSFGDPDLIAYAVSKHAVLGLARSLASGLGTAGITVNCIQPGAIRTAMTEPLLADARLSAFWTGKSAMRRVGEPHEVAALIAFLLSDDGSYVSGHGIFIDGASMQQP